MKIEALNIICHVAQTDGLPDTSRISPAYCPSMHHAGNKRAPLQPLSASKTVPTKPHLAFSPPLWVYSLHEATSPIHPNVNSNLPTPQQVKH